MVLIPPDIGLRLRLQNELLPQPVTPLREIPADLPDLKTGQTFSARIQEVLPESTYRALVAGKSITLSLPESVKSGDVLELVVVDRTPKSIIAQLAAPGAVTAEAGAIEYPHTTFSRAAQLIRTLLPAEGEQAAAAPLNRGEPLLTQPPRTGLELAPVLGNAVAESGLFYESHQAQWVAGKLPLAELLKEPQGMHSSPEAKIAAQSDKLLVITGTKQDGPGQPLSASPTAAAAAAGAESGIQLSPAQLSLAAGQMPTLEGQIALPGDEEAAVEKMPQPTRTPEAQGPNPPSSDSTGNAGKAEAAAWVKEMARLHSGAQPLTPQQLASGLRESAASQPQEYNPPISPPLTAASIPDELRPLVQQQLDSAGTQRLMWHGEVWPGQTMHWEIEWKDQGGSAEQDAAEPWATTLRLKTPRLGEVEAGLRLGPRGVRIALVTPSAGSAADLRAAAPLLEQALASAGVPMRGFIVRQFQEPESAAAGSVDG